MMLHDVYWHTYEQCTSMDIERNAQSVDIRGTYPEMESEYDRPIDEENTSNVAADPTGSAENAFQDLVKRVANLYEREMDTSSMQTDHVVCDPKYNKRNWNDEFQSYYESELAGFQQVRRVTQDLERLNDQFVQHSSTIAKQIVRDLALPADQKVYEPVKEQKGLAGGLKFEVGNIFFKYATDAFGIYGSDFAAQKAACNEIRAINSIVDANLPELHVTLTALFFYRGHCLIAIAKCPIDNEKTLVYGSADQGRTYLNSSLEFESLMNTVANKMNLKSHVLSYKNEEGYERKVTLCSAGDVEGHLSEVDGRFYVIDLARHFPPVRPTPNTSEHLYLQFRPEFVKQLSKPLSSDVFSKFGIHDQHIHNKEALDAYDELINITIPRFGERLIKHAQSLDKKSKNSMKGEQQEKELREEMTDMLTLELNLSKYLHKEGINIRYLGYILNCLGTTNILVRQLILRHMLNRCVKRWAYACMHAISTKFPSDEPYICISAIFLSALSSAQSDMSCSTWYPDNNSMNAIICPIIKWDDPLETDNSFWSAVPWMLRFSFGAHTILRSTDIQQLRQSYSITAPCSHHARPTRIQSTDYADMSVVEQTEYLSKHFSRPLVRQLISGLGLKQIMTPPASPTQSAQTTTSMNNNKNNNDTNKTTPALPLETLSYADILKKKSAPSSRITTPVLGSTKLNDNNIGSPPLEMPPMISLPPPFARTYSEIIQSIPNEESFITKDSLQKCPPSFDRLPFMRAFYSLSLGLDCRCKRVRNPDLNRIHNAESKFAREVKGQMNSMSDASAPIVEVLSTLYQERDRVAFPLIEKMFAKLNKSVTTEPRMMLTYLATVMNASIVTLFKTRRRTPALIESVLQDYYSLLHMLRALANWYPSIQRRAVQKVWEFQKDPAKRTKTIVADIGEFLIYILLAIWSGQISWSNIAPSFVNELLHRNVRWLLKKKPELQPTPPGHKNEKFVSKCYRLRTTLRGSADGLRIVMLQVYLITQAKEDSNKSTTIKKPDEQSVIKLATEAKSIFEVNTWNDFFTRMRVPHCSLDEINDKLIEAVKASAKKGYHDDKQIIRFIGKDKRVYFGCICPKGTVCPYGKGR